MNSGLFCVCMVIVLDLYSASIMLVLYKYQVCIVLVYGFIVLLYCLYSARNVLVWCLN